MGGITDFEAEQTTPISDSEKMRFGYDDTEANGLKQEPNFVPVSRSLPESNFVPASRSLFGPAPSAIAGIRSLMGCSDPHARFFPRQTWWDVEWIRMG
jgi:hypothetical protein